MLKFLEKKRRIAVCITFLVITIAFLPLLCQKNIVEKYERLNKKIPSDIDSDQETLNTDNITKNKPTNVYPCAEIAMPKLEMKVGYWQHVNDDSMAFVFSAYFIHETQNIVIIAIRKQVKAKSYFCQFWYKRRGNQYTCLYETIANVTLLPKTHDLLYAAELFECRVHFSPEHPPTYVSIVDIKCGTPKNILHVQHVSKPGTISRNFTLCLPPLYGNLPIHGFIEWIEFNKMLGADKLFVYNYTSNMKLRTVLEFYSNRSFIDVIQWNLPESKNDENVSKPISIHYHGQIAALNDCLYRSKYESEFIVNVDRDEFIIPRVENETTWHQMITHVNRNETVYIVRQTFFRKKWEMSKIEITNNTLVEKYKLTTLQKLLHEQQIYSPEIRSKYFARALPVSSLMIHTVLRENNFVFPVNTALLHHYRDIRPKDGFEPIKVLDRTVPKKYGSALIKNVATIWSELNELL